MPVTQTGGLGGNTAFRDPFGQQPNFKSKNPQVMTGFNPLTQQYSTGPTLQPDAQGEQGGPEAGGSLAGLQRAGSAGRAAPFDPNAARQAMEQQHQWSIDAEARAGAREAANRQAQQAHQQLLMGQFSQMIGPGQAGPEEAPVEYPTARIQSAQDLAFARAKDKAGEVARSGLTALHSSMAGRGLARSGVEGRGTASLIQGGQQDLSNVLSQQATEGAQQAVHGAEVGYQGRIAQRGQNIQAKQARNQVLLGLLSASGGRGAY